MSAVRIRYRPLWGGSSILVRAPACHAGGCEFKPRLSRDKTLSFERVFRFFKPSIQQLPKEQAQANTELVGYKTGFKILVINSIGVI